MNDLRHVMHETDGEGEACCAMPYCEQPVWGVLVVRGEVTLWDPRWDDGDPDYSRVWAEMPDGILGRVYIRERLVGFCADHMQTRYADTIVDDAGEGPASEGMGDCTICGAKNTPVVWFLGGTDDAGEGRACAVCCDEQGVC